MLRFVGLAQARCWQGVNSRRTERFRDGRVSRDCLFINTAEGQQPAYTLPELLCRSHSLQGFYKREGRYAILLQPTL